MAWAGGLLSGRGLRLPLGGHITDRNFPIRPGDGRGVARDPFPAETVNPEPGPSAAALIARSETEKLDPEHRPGLDRVSWRRLGAGKEQ